MITKSSKAKIPEVVYTPQFLKFVEYYAKEFRARNGHGRWLAEYQDMEKKGLFAPRIIRALYIQILTDRFYLGYIRYSAIWYICVYARDAAEKYINERVNALYEIRVITGELAYDEDDDPYTDLSYDEASQIVKALNEEAEEELFVMKRKK